MNKWSYSYLQRGNAPSIATLTQAFSQYHVDSESITKIRQLMKGELDPVEVLGDSSDARLAVAYGHMLDLVMRAIDKLLGTYGVEYLKTKRASYDYCNTGDSYAPTVVRCHTRKTWLVTSWGDITEREGVRE